jgi:cysteine desulfurase
MIYFDNAASAKPRLEAVKAFNSVITENFANPAALHKGGIEAEKIIKKSKEQILSHLPKSGSLIFTSGATESNNLAILNSVKCRSKTKTVTTAIEHPSVSELISDKSGEACKDTALLSMTAVCGETGYIVDICDRYEQIKSEYPDCIVHVDNAQGFMKLSDINADLISISAHKIGGIPGVGALWVRDGIRVKPMMLGGGQQKGTRPGTEPTALIAAFSAATEHEFQPHELHDRLIDGLKRLNLQINSSNNIPNIINFSCGVKSEVMLHFLAEHNIYVSSGSACARGKKSKILPYFKVSDRDIDTAIRVSFGWQNTIEEVDELLNILEKGIKRWKQ